MKFRIICEDSNKKSASIETETNNQVRLKLNKLSIPLINAVRAFTLKRYSGYKKDRLLPNQPTDNEFEIYVISLCISMLKDYYLGHYKTTALEDKKLLMEKDVKGHKRFAVIYRLEAKQIIINNIRYLEVLLNILNHTTIKSKFKETYMERIDFLENETEFYKNRRAIRHYLRSYYYYMKK